MAKTEKEYNRACANGDVMKVIHSRFKPKTLRYVCRGGNHELVKFFLMRGVEDYSEGLRGACEGNHPELIPIMIEPGSTDWRAALQGICRSGNLQLFEIILKLCSNEIKNNNVLYTAGKYGHEEIVKRVFQLDETDGYPLLDGLYRGKHYDLINKYFPEGI